MAALAASVPNPITTARVTPRTPSRVIDAETHELASLSIAVPPLVLPADLARDDLVEGYLFASADLQRSTQQRVLWPGSEQINTNYARNVKLHEGYT